MAFGYRSVLNIVRNALDSIGVGGEFINENEIGEFFIAGGDATACIKSTCYNLRKANYNVTVLSDCITSWSKKKIPEMIEYYESKGCKISSLNNLL